jgi:hypothetical protein
MSTTFGPYAVHRGHLERKLLAGPAVGTAAHHHQIARSVGDQEVDRAPMENIIDLPGEGSEKKSVARGIDSLDEETDLFLRPEGQSLFTAAFR